MQKRVKTAPGSKQVKKAKPDLKKTLIAPFDEDHPAGLWVDTAIWDRVRRSRPEQERKELFEASSRYLELAAMALEGHNGVKPSRKKSKGNGNKS